MAMDLTWLDQLGGLAGGIAGLGAGSIPTPSSSSGSGTTTSSTNNTNFIDQLINTLNQSRGTTTSTSTTNLTPGLQGLLDSLTQKYSSLSAPDLNGYQAQQTDQINRNAQLQKEAINNNMASRGLASSPAGATAENNVDNTRFSNITNLAQSIPMLKNQLQLSNLGAAGSFLSSAPKGVTTTGSTDTTNTGLQSGTTNGNSSSNVNSTTQQQQQQKQGGGAGGFLGALGAILPFIL